MARIELAIFLFKKPGEIFRDFKFRISQLFSTQQITRTSFSCVFQSLLVETQQ